jgi:hypothetical protein
LFALIALGLACDLPQGQAALETAVAQTLEAGFTEEAAAATPTDAPTATVEATEPPTAEPTPTVVHVMIPNAPAGVERFLTDASSLAYANQAQAPGDDFTTNRLERPFTTGAMDYLPQLDLRRAELDVLEPWVYVTLFLEGPVQPADGAYYGVELDLDGNGEGEWFIYGQAPASTEWTTDGVRAAQDANDDAGGEEPGMAEPPTGLTDGFENLVFDSGQGADPDTAWIRQGPGGPAQVQLAFKTSLVGTVEFLWGGWTDQGPKDPLLFDYHDHFTPQQAGSPHLNHTNYPLNQLHSVDNTCLDSLDFATSGSEPRLCVIPGSIAGVVWRDRCLTTGGDGGEPLVLGEGCVGSPPTDWSADGIYEPSWEPPFPNVVVDLGAGSCPSTGLATATTDSAGRYSFNNLPAGTYCVSIGILAYNNEDQLVPGGWTYPSTVGEVARQTINLLAGQNKSGVNFGLMWQFGD